MTAFAAGLKLAAAFGTVAAKTTSLALASLATGADKFSELVKQEAMGPQKKNHVQVAARGSRPQHKNRRDRRFQRPRELMARN